MTAAEPTGSRPGERRRWKRRALVVTILIALLLASWYGITANGELARAGRVQIGQTRDEVVAIMGPEPWAIYNRNRIESGFYGTGQQLRLELSHWVYRATGHILFRNRVSDWIIHVRYDDGGRVDLIRRGTEIVEASTGPVP